MGLFFRRRYVPTIPCSIISRIRDWVHGFESCPRCGQRFSDWFVWHCRCYCYPCWQASRVLVLERAALAAAQGGTDG